MDFHLKTPSYPQKITDGAQVRPELLTILGIANRIPTKIPRLYLLSEQDKGLYTEQKYTFYVDDIPVPMYLLLPKTPPPYQAVLAFHGHGMGVQQILGNYPDEQTAQQMIAHDENFAQRLAEDGFLVCAIEQRGFGERVTDQVNEGGNSCQHLSHYYMMQGKTLLGERLRDGMAALNYLVGREDVQAVGCIGHSGGGTTALFLAALDTRLSNIVISGYFCDFHHSILAMPHCACNYIPGLMLDIGTIAALIAPRPLLLINGENDPIFPISGFEQPYQTLQQAYETAPDHLATHLHTHGHQLVYGPAAEWLLYHREKTSN